jgi:hypothetical protein
VKRLFFLILITLLLIIVPECYAEKHEVVISYGPGCKHFDGDDDLNEKNHIIGASLDKWFGLTFINSNDVRSWFVGKTFRTNKWEPLNENWFGRLNVRLGLLYGYEEDVPDVAGWTIAPIPTMEIGHKKISMEILVVPFDGGVLGLMFNYTF